MTERLARWSEEQGHVFGGLGCLAPKTQAMAARAIEKLRPVMQQAAERIQSRPERVAARKRDAEMDVARKELLELRMRAFQREQRAGTFYVDPVREKQWKEKARAEEERQRAGIGALSGPDLQRSLRQAKGVEREREAQSGAPSRSRGMGLER
jgi:hypothetical protein